MGRCFEKSNYFYPSQKLSISNRNEMKKRTQNPYRIHPFAVLFSFDVIFFFIFLFFLFPIEKEEEEKK